MTGNHVLDQYLPGQKSIFTLTEPVCRLFASMIKCFWNDRVIPFFPDPSGPSLPPKHDTTEPLTGILLPKYRLSVLEMLPASSPVPTNVREVFVSLIYSLSSLKDFPALLSPTSRIYHQ